MSTNAYSHWPDTTQNRNADAPMPSRLIAKRKSVYLKGLIDTSELLSSFCEILLTLHSVNPSKCKL